MYSLLEYVLDGISKPSTVQGIWTLASVFAILSYVGSTIDYW